MKKQSLCGAKILFCLPAIFVLLGILGACEVGEDEGAEKDPNNIAIMTWNMQALFDGVDDGNEYEEYRAEAGWSQEKYAGRISVISKAIDGMATVPDIIAMQEIESARVVNDLASSLSKQGYGYTHFATCAGMSLGLGVLSRFPLLQAKAHSISINGDVAPRPMLEIRVSPGKARPAASTSQDAPESLVLFICHWKSKLGGDAATEDLRRASARVIIRRMRELAEQEPALPVIIMGDLNENYDEFYRRNGGAICALLPDDPWCAELTGFNGLDERSAELCAELQKDFIILSKSKPPVTRHFSGQPISLYSPWAEMENGSYYYRNDWETIDHFLLSAQLFNGSGWDFANCMVVDNSAFVNSGGHPMAYNPRTGYGLSDHLPLLLFLKKN
ncbi:MAG: endonuclease/exonuclease/phosphatase family protein [Treponema sp.]|jgi:endonuclease/exonuclease/phosphatase family metal-dependent hydrolase|nr:endonuclease/exonuclease/phosphatase family protein [Treponema sp.]